MGWSSLLAVFIGQLSSVKNLNADLRSQTENLAKVKMKDLLGNLITTLQTLSCSNFKTQ